ncbi:NUDIX hydrolase protein conserved [Leptomonas pyrrhocoris]|uniref:NUDIX hydrolase protein conserved n=1 Tax=Leptomonas pyrrhocoris TaxID=157538 RepID=A0A0M9G0H9_LEPPY|nr:NUDIX hydrolase protein conserved [Leptomonas pyrrhocoris]KPA79855.1 NUDIX hydrolase protein conserved [Leptomonas pyrrhocoris]|eukprot:XP_015658294.1 NUDIX hydrolase protein conserved [Leptomonas pyrrhocoris]
MNRAALAASLPQSTQEWIPLLRRALSTPIEAVHYPNHFYLHIINGTGASVGFSPQKSPMKLSSVRESAVLVFLSPTTTGKGFQDMCITLTKRTDKVGSHKNQMSFPGGHVDLGETPQTAALREAQEETGLLPSTYEVVGSMTAIGTNQRGSRVTPFVAVSRDPAQPYCASPDEVDSVHYLHLSSLMLDAPHHHARVIKYHSFSSKWPSYFPCFFTSSAQSVLCPPVCPSPKAAPMPDDNGYEPMLSDDFPGELVWGLTSFITCELVARLANELLGSTPSSDRIAEIDTLLEPTHVVARDPLETPTAAKAATLGSDAVDA